MDEIERSGAARADEWCSVELRAYQQAAVLAWQLAQKRGLVVLPTGSGKTSVAAAAMALTRARTLCLVPTRALLNQWLTELSKLYPGSIGCLGDGRQDIQRITIATFESAFRWMPRLENVLLCIDEVYRRRAKLQRRRATRERQDHSLPTPHRRPRGVGYAVEVLGPSTPSGSEGVRLVSPGEGGPRPVR
jgi:superfamily II DNA or RNA helicase